MGDVKKIGILTSGGDAPGMNAAVRAVVRTAIYNGIEVLGVKKGYNGLIHDDFIEMDSRSVCDILQKGGTILQTARCLEFKDPEMVKKGVEIAKSKGLDGLVVVGGDGSFRGARDLTRAGLPTVAIPGTIDNDIDCTEYAIGYDTCLNTVIGVVDKLRDTCSSHERCSVIEVMGKGGGYIAIESAIACGADVVLVPEVPFDMQKDVLDVIKADKKRGKAHNIVIVAEGVGGVVEMAKTIEKETGYETRAAILGHFQRGGSPSVKDRVVASQFGQKAVELLIEGKSNRIVRMQNGQVTDVDIEEGLKMKKTIPESMLKLAKQLTV